MSDKILLEKDCYQALIKDPLYAERIKVGLDIGVIQIIEPRKVKGEITCQE